MRRLFLLLLALCLAAPAAASLPLPVAKALKQAGIPLQAVALAAQPVDAQSLAVAHRSDAALNPASLMKLVTTFAALELLGPAYTFRTAVLAENLPENGVLTGNLYLRGSGDPKFTYDRLWLLLRELRNRGLREIRGDLVLDRSAFVASEHDPAAFDGKPQRPYNVGPDALLFNFATLQLTLLPENGGVRVFAEPHPAGLEIVNRLQASDTRQCPSEWREALSAQFLSGQLILSGDYPRVCGEKRWHLAGLANTALLAGTFMRLWRELGGEFAGTVREGSAPVKAVTLAVSESPPLNELVRDINKFSNNVMAQQLYLKVGAGKTVAAEKAIRDWLARKGLDFPELVIENGSGLSRKNRIAAGSLARLLAAAWASPVMPEFIASLPIAAIDGTVRKKFNGNEAAGFAHLKTGSLENVRGIAGYLLDRRGRRHILVFLVNHENAARAEPAFDAFLAWLWSGAS